MTFLAEDAAPAHRESLASEALPTRSHAVSTSDPAPIRRVGVEIEFTGLGVRRAGEALAVHFGGTLCVEDAHAVPL
ncbi:amidoligase family protein [Ancylobacter crimeensis]|uniref:amidoligase family protein n=1 Tax=Ancylobacter crimeensis TaxID=2579147 RepID=UPI003CCFF278